MVRIDKAEHDSLVSRRGARIMDFTGRPMRGWLLVAGVDADDLGDWVDRVTAFAATLPPK
jgi:hypothetical protein